MNLPNKLTMLRMIMVIPFIATLLMNMKGIALILFIVASFTDFLDGYLARKNNLVTNFGKFMDPLADKLLVCSALVCLTDMKHIHVLVTLIIIGREFIVSGLRLVAAEQGLVIAASKIGKSKTVFQMLGIILKIITVNHSWFPVPNPMTSAPHPLFICFDLAGDLFIFIAVVLTIVSLIDYLNKNKQVFFFDK